MRTKGMNKESPLISGSNKRIFFILVIALGVISFSINSHLKSRLVTTLSSRSFSGMVSPELLHRLALGYGNLYSAVLWMETIAYYGAYLDHADFEYLARMLTAISTLNPKADHAYYMAATVLPWSTSNTHLSRPLILKAMENFPKDWRWPYYAGFNSYWFDHDLKSAVAYMSQSSKLPGAPPIIASLAARMRLEAANLDAALIFLQTLLKNKQEASFRKYIQSQIRELETEKVLRRIDKMLSSIPLPQRNRKVLKSFGLENILLPDGGHVVFDSDGLPVSSVSGKRFGLYVPPKRQHGSVTRSNRR